MLDDRFRMRADTRCTADSRDSGIDVRSRNPRVPRGEDRRVLFQENFVEEKADRHVFHPFFVIFGSCGLWMYVKYRSTSRWCVRSPYIFTVAWIAFVCGVASFSFSTWPLFGWWSLYIAGVTLMFFISIAHLF